MMLSYRAILTAIVSLGFPPQMFETFAAMNDADRKLVTAGKDVDGAAANRLRATARFRDVAAAQVVQQAMKDKLAAFFQTWDAVLMPISPVTAFKHMQEGDFNSRILDVDGKPAPYPSLLMWISLATFLHAPAIAVPAGRTASGMPVGVQLVGPWRGEDRLFDYAAAIEDVLGGFEPPPL
jgi:amidase